MIEGQMETDTGLTRVEKESALAFERMI